MPQSLVRNIEQPVVTKLRQRAAALGVSTEEAHHRPLRTTLSDEEIATNLKFHQHLLNIPKGEEGDDWEFPRIRDLPRQIDL